MVAARRRRSGSRVDRTAPSGDRVAPPAAELVDPHADAAVPVRDGTGAPGSTGLPNDPIGVDAMIDLSDEALTGYANPARSAVPQHPAGITLLETPAIAPGDELLRVADPVGGLEVEIVRDRLVSLISGTGPGVHLQPVVHIQSGVQVGVEALARFPGGMSTPEWFRTAHGLGLGGDLELRILHEVLRRLDGCGPGFVGVNLSASVLLDPRTVEILERGADAELVVEITDQTVMPKLSVLRSRLDELRHLGIRIAIHVSEFGLATMQLLMVARPDVVKLDPPLTSAIAAGRAGSATADNMFTFFRQEGVFVVSVGVETQAQLVALQDAGVDAYQGFIVGADRW